MTSLTYGLMSMTLTPNGLSVQPLHFWISARRISGGMWPAPMMPRPPAFETAEASSAVPIQAMPPWKIGYFMLSNLQIALFSNIRLVLLSPFHDAGCPGESGTKTGQGNEIAFLEAMRLHCLRQGNRYGRR